MISVISSVDRAARRKLSWVSWVRSVWGGQLGKGLPADMEDIPGVEAGGDGAVEGVLPDEVQGAPLEGIDLVVDEDVSWAGQGEQELVVVVEMEAAHVPGHIVIQL